METTEAMEASVGRRKTQQEPEPRGPRVDLHIRGSAEWIAYVEAWSGERYAPPASLFEWALVELARKQGRELPPKR